MNLILRPLSLKTITSLFCEVRPMSLQGSVCLFQRWCQEVEAAKELADLTQKEKGGSLIERTASQAQICL